MALALKPSSTKSILMTTRRALRRLPDMTYRQTIAFRRITALKEEFARNASLWNVGDMERIADECEALIEKHFPGEIKEVAVEQT